MLPFDDLVEHRLHTLPLHDASRPVSGCFCRPLRNLMQTDAVLDQGPFDHDREFSCGTRLRNERIIPEAGDSQRNRFVKRFGLDVDAM